MSSTKPIAIQSLAPLACFSIVLGLCLAIYLTDGKEASESFEIVAAFGWSVLLGMWLVADARRRKQTPCFDFGLFCYLFLPLMVPWYCFWSRGWRGAKTFLAIVGLWLLPYLLAGFVWAILYG